MNRKKIMVTGASGFVGAALVNTLDASNVICLGRTPVRDREFIFSDYSISKSTIEKFKDVKAIVHCAGRAHIMNGDEPSSALLYSQANVDTTVNLAKMADLAGVERFVYLSTIKVNGNFTDRPFVPQDDVSPTDQYALSKLEAEKKLIEICKLGSMDYAIIRPPLIYGPRVKGNLDVLSRFLARGMPNPFICINKNKRSMVSIYNLISLITCCCEFKDTINKILFVSDGHDISTADAVDMIAKAIGSRNFPVPVPAYVWRLLGILLDKPDYVGRIIGNLQVDISKTTNFLKWVPPVSVSDGFRDSFRR